jgi:hypothetical protein
MDKTAKITLATLAGDVLLFLAGCIAAVAAAACLAFTVALCARISVNCWHVFFR